MNLFKKKAVENPTESRLFQMANWLAYLSVSDQARQPYKFHPIFYAAAFAIVKNVSRYGVYLERESKPGDRIYDHPVLNLLRKPNVFMTWTTFIQAIVCNLLLQPGASSNKGGQCFILPNSTDADPRNDYVDLWRGKVPLSLFPLSDERIEPRIVNEMIVSWQYTNARNETKNFGFNEIIRIYQYNPYSLLSGLANQHAARYALAFDADANDYNESIMRNSAVPMGFLYSEKPIGSETKKKEILRSFFEMVGGKKRAGSNAILDGGIDYKKIGLTNAEMQFLESRGFSRDLIIAAMGVNKIATGNYEQINYATLIEGRRMLHYDTYMPIADLIAEGFNSQWIGYVEPGLKLKFDYDSVDVLRPDLTKPSAAVLNFTNAGAPFSLACRISGVKLPEDAPKKYPWIEENPKSFGGGGLFLNAPAPAATRALARAEDEPPMETGLEYWKGFIQRVFEPGEKRYKQTIIEYFNEQRNKLQDLVDAWAEGKKEVRDIDLDAEVYFDITSTETDRLMGKVKPVVKEQMARDAAELARQGIRFNVTDEKAAAVLARREKFLAGLNDLTFKKVLDEVDPIIALGREENWTVGQLARELKPAISRVYEGQKNHAQTVARTEIGAVSSETRFTAMDENGIEYLEWVTAGDEDVRDSHRAQGTEGNNVVRTGEVFTIVNLRYPCEAGGDAGEVINCRCVALPRKNL